MWKAQNGFYLPACPHTFSSQEDAQAGRCGSLANTRANTLNFCRDQRALAQRSPSLYWMHLFQPVDEVSNEHYTWCRDLQCHCEGRECKCSIATLLCTFGNLYPFLYSADAVCCMPVTCSSTQSTVQSAYSVTPSSWPHLCGEPSSSLHGLCSFCKLFIFMNLQQLRNRFRILWIKETT